LWEIMLEMATRLQVPEAVLFREVGGEAVLLHTDTGKYFGLDPVGTRMWQVLAEEGSVEPACQRLLAEFDVEEEHLRRDLLELVEKLEDHQLLEAVSES
jgi:Coenzyme PQQ synthesis protein D (PqqD)